MDVPIPSPDFIFIETLFIISIVPGPDFIFIRTLFGDFPVPGPGFILLVALIQKGLYNSVSPLKKQNVF